ncbi:MAG: sensor signal transduction histidine kinase [Acidobacteriales bacterium]|nr:sensor signal transduction histidine kinase [Terriglobales bacterium]
MSQILQNPLFIKLGATLFLLMAVLAAAFILLKYLRRQLVSNEQDSKQRVSVDNSAFTLLAYEGVIRKLKEQEKELERLRRSERDQANESASMSEAVLSNLGSGVVLFNTVNLVRQANPAAKALLGYASASGLHSRDIFRGVSQVRMPVTTKPAGSKSESPSQLLEAIDTAIKQGTTFRRIEADYRTPTGELRVLGITISPVRSSSGEALGAAALISDLTEITQLSQQMRLRESMAALGEMSAGIAHEFKNSLATISGYAQMLQNGADANTSTLFAGKIAGETTSLARIVTDFLNFAKPQGLQREPLEILGMVKDCAKEAGVQLMVENCPEALTVLGDPTALRQAFSNLLRNSAEAARPGEAPTVKLSGASTVMSTTITLSDNGVGMPQDQLSRIFIPFFTTKAEGTGLGLALVHRILTEHSATIGVSTNESGTTFTIAFPPSISAANRANIAAQPE